MAILKYNAILLLMALLAMTAANVCNKDNTITLHKQVQNF